MEEGFLFSVYDDQHLRGVNPAQWYRPWKSELVSFFSQTARLLNEALTKLFGTIVDIPKVNAPKRDKGILSFPFNMVDKSTRHVSPWMGCHEQPIWCQSWRVMNAETRHWSTLFWNSISSTLLDTTRSKYNYAKTLVHCRGRKAAWEINVVEEGCKPFLSVWSQKLSLRITLSALREYYQCLGDYSFAKWNGKMYLLFHTSRKRQVKRSKKQINAKM